MKNPLKLIDRRSLLVFLGIFGLLTLLSVTVIVLTVSRQHKKAVQARIERVKEDKRAITGSTGYGMEDFFLPSLELDKGIIYPAREPRRFWTREEVESFWIDPSLAGLSDMDERSDEMIFQSLGLRDSHGD